MSLSTLNKKSMDGMAQLLREACRIRDDRHNSGLSAEELETIITQSNRWKSGYNQYLSKRSQMQEKLHETFNTAGFDCNIIDNGRMFRLPVVVTDGREVRYTFSNNCLHREDNTPIHWTAEKILWWIWSSWGGLSPSVISFV